MCNLLHSCLILYQEFLGVLLPFWRPFVVDFTGGSNHLAVESLRGNRAEFLKSSIGKILHGLFWVFGGEAKINFLDFSEH